MNILLQNKLDELQNASDFECWYLVKQPTEFQSLCYLVSFLKSYNSNKFNDNLSEYISKRIQQVNSLKPELKLSDNYRALRVAANFGLITMTSKKYEDAIVTETFDEITSRCNGEYENTETYDDIIKRQIEKMFISSDIDEASKTIRKDYRLYPVMLLYKVLLELGRSYHEYRISLTEYRYLVATTKRYEDFLDTLLLIKLLRQEDQSTVADFEKFRDKFDNRLIRALRQLDTLNFNGGYIELNSEKIDEVAKKVYDFEQKPYTLTTDNYLKFLGSTETLSNLFNMDEDNFNYDKDENKGDNIILYGVPGCGKSYKIKNEYCNDNKYMQRVVFHPDYTYSDFIGQILPVVEKSSDGNKVSYEFNPGPFTSVLKKAVNDPNNMYYLIIEEVNRGNAPAIFGDVFQLLDRVNGVSEYGITNFDIADCVYGNKEHTVKIPNNITILGTMNTADQNVYPLDNAFKRRWKMINVENNILECKHADDTICGTNITWKQFATSINDLMIELNDNSLSSEDSRLGAYFVKKEELDDIEIFADKVIMYLWNDAFKYNRDRVFKSEYKTLEDLLKAFKMIKFEVFSESLNFYNYGNDDLMDTEQ